jgi:zinc protease
MQLSRDYPGYGTFAITASVDLADVEQTEEAISAIVEQLRAKPVDADTLERARRPMLEGYDNALKSNAGWMRLADRAQSRADDIARFATGKERLLGLTADDVQAMAQRYLAPADAVEFAVLPEASQPAEPD